MVSDSTFERAYGYWFRRYAAWVRSQFGAFEPEAAYSHEVVMKWLSELAAQGCKPSTINTAAHAVRYFAELEGYELEFRRGDLPPVKTTVPESISEDEVWRLVEGTPDPRDRAIIALMYDCALRLSELVSLNVEDVDLEDGTVFVRERKGAETYGLPQKIPFSEKTRRILEEYLRLRLSVPADTDALFLGDKGRIDRSTVYRIVRKAGERVLGKKIRPHVLRHTRAIVLRRKGWLVEDVKDFLGHISSKTTMRYARVEPSDLKRKLEEIGERHG